jgi:hypothetical protein
MQFFSSPELFYKSANIGIIFISLKTIRFFNKTLTIRMTNNYTKNLPELISFSQGREIVLV